MSRGEDEESGGVDFGTGTTDGFDYCSVLVEGFSEGLARGVCYALKHCFEGVFGGADGAHAVVDAARSDEWKEGR